MKIARQALGVGFCAALFGGPVAADDPPRLDAPLGGRLVESDAVLRRVGTGPVEAVGISGITWKTVDPIDVTIRIRPSRDGLSLRRLPANLWPEMTETLALAGAVAGITPVPWLDVPTAGRAAAGTVLVLSDAAGHTAFRITGSATTVTKRGTKVELVGRVRRRGTGISSALFEACSIPATRISGTELPCASSRASVPAHSPAEPRSASVSCSLFCRHACGSSSFPVCRFRLSTNKLSRFGLADPLTVAELAALPAPPGAQRHIGLPIVDV